MRAGSAVALSHVTTQWPTSYIRNETADPDRPPAKSSAIKVQQGRAPPGRYTRTWILHNNGVSDANATMAAPAPLSGLLQRSSGERRAAHRRAVVGGCA